jgi:hypothetical protein
VGLSYPKLIGDVKENIINIIIVSIFKDWLIILKRYYIDTTYILYYTLELFQGRILKENLKMVASSPIFFYNNYYAETQFRTVRSHLSLLSQV